MKNIIREYGFGIALAGLLIVGATLVYADIAINGVLATPGKTFAGLAIVGVGLLATNAVTWIIVSERRERAVSEAVASVNAQHAVHNARVAAGTDW